MQLALDLGMPAEPPPGPPRLGDMRRPLPAAQPDRQSCLPGLERRSADSIFLALRPDAAAKAAIAQVMPAVVAWLGPGARHVGPDRYHVSTLGVGSWDSVPSALAPAIDAAVSGLDLRGFEIRFDQLASFGGGPGGLPLVLLPAARLDAFDQFRTRLRTALRDRKLVGQSPRIVTPHLTLLYHPRKIEICGVPPIAWQGRELLLIHSARGRTCHHVLCRWPLPD